MPITTTKPTPPATTAERFPWDRPDYKRRWRTVVRTRMLADLHDLLERFRRCAADARRLADELPGTRLADWYDRTPGCGSADDIREDLITLANVVAPFVSCIDGATPGRPR